MSETSFNWSNELELKFIELYQAEPILWDARHCLYKDKIKNFDAWVRIGDIMKVSVPLLKKKDSLMSSYRKYRKLVKDSMHSGAGSADIYKPVWFGYEAMNSFLSEGLRPKNTTNTIETASEQSEEIRIEDKEGDVAENSVETVAENINTSRSVAEQEISTVKRRRTQSKDSSKLLQVETVLKDSINTLNVALKKRETREDEYDLYGKILASKLRRVPENERLELMYEIDGLFLRRQSNRNFYTSPSPSTSSTYNDENFRPGSSSSFYSQPPATYNTERFSAPEAAGTEFSSIIHAAFNGMEDN